MGLFHQWRKKHLGKTDENDEPMPQAPAGAAPRTQSYFDSLSACIGPARLRQNAFGRQVVRDRNWSVDFSEGIIRFGEDAYPIQFLGTESHLSNTWMWAFVNPGGYPDALLTDSSRFYNQCVKEGMDELRGSEIPLTPMVNGHNIASMAAATAEGGACYYRCPYENGAAFVLVGNIPDSVFCPTTVQEVVETAADLIRQLPLNHKILIHNLLADNCTDVTEEGVGRFADGSTLTVRFDDKGRVASLKPGFVPPVD